MGWGVSKYVFENNPAHRCLDHLHDYRLRMIIGCKIQLTFRTRLTALKPC